jgi:hypothetical protein
MSRPLIANKQRESEADKWHREVFKAHGKLCFFCGKAATDAMHIIPRSKLGPLRYAIPVQNGRPGCRECHERQERGELRFGIRFVRIAIAAHNKIAKVKLELP